MSGFLRYCCGNRVDRSARPRAHADPTGRTQHFLSMMVRASRAAYLLANSPDWLKAAPMRENLLASWRQSGQKQENFPYLLNHNAKYKRLLPPCCDFANGVRSFAQQQVISEGTMFP